MLRIIGIITFAFVFSSCANKSDSILAVFKATEEGLIQSNSAISNSSTIVYHALDEKLAKPESVRQASIWQPKAMLIKSKSVEIINYLDSLIIELKKEAGIKSENGRETFREDNLDAVSRLFINKNAGGELYEKLQNYRMDILAVDPELNKQFFKNSIIITNEFEQAKNIKKDFTNTFFDHVSVITALAMLRKFENNVRVMENQFVTYCFNKIGSTDGEGFFTKFGVLVGQNTSIIKSGGQIQIQAGVGSFTTINKPEITIDNKKIQLDDSRGVALYEFKSPLKSGKYTVPVKIEYIDVDGTKKVFMQKVEYTVIE